MLLLLAWFLWLYNENNKTQNTQNENNEESPKLAIIPDEVIEEQVQLSESTQYLLEASLRDTLQAAVSDTTSECLFIGHDHENRKSKKLEENAPHTIKSEKTILQNTDKRHKNQTEENLIFPSNVISDENEQKVFNFDDEDVDYADAMLHNDFGQTKQINLSLNALEEKSDVLDISNSSDDFLESDVHNENTSIKTASLFSQPSFKKEKAEVTRIKRNPVSPSQAFAPIQGNQNVNDVGMNSFLNNTTHTNYPLHRDNFFHDSDHKSSSLNLLVDGKVDGMKHGVSCIENDIRTAPVTLRLNGVETDDTTPEDNEVEAVFKSDHVNHQSNEGIEYTTTHGTHMSVTAEPAGRIHSIVIKAPITEKTTKIRCSSPQVRATSPRIHIGGPTHEEEMVHLIVNKQKPAIHTESKVTADIEDGVPSKKESREVFETVSSVVNDVFVEAGNPGFTFADLEKPRGDEVHKLKNRSPQRKSTRDFEQPVAETSDFDAIMKRRKKYVDTMDDAGRLLGQLANRDEKISGGRKDLSKHWSKIKDAVTTKRYLKFED